MSSTLQLPITEMMKRYDAFDAEEEAVKSFPAEIAKAINRGGTTGNALVDLVVVRAGVYVPEVVKNYEPIEEKLRRNAGRGALVIVSEERQFYEETWGRWEYLGGRWLFDDGRVRVFSGVLSGEAPVIDLERQSWAIPTVDGYRKQVARGVSGVLEARRHFSEPIVYQGDMPVRDTIKKPRKADRSRNSALEREVIHSKTHITGLKTRRIKEVTLVVGAEEAKKLIDGQQHVGSVLLTELAESE